MNTGLVQRYLTQVFITDNYLIEFTNSRKNKKCFEMKIYNKDAVETNCSFSLTLSIPYEDGFDLADLISFISAETRSHAC